MFIFFFFICNVGFQGGLENLLKKIFPFRKLLYICSPKKQLLKKEIFNGKS